MTLITNNASCTDCGEPITGASETLEQPHPCPNCGSIKRTFGLSITEQVTARDGYRVKNKETGKKWHIDDRAGPDYSRSLDKLVHLERTIDWKNDKYRELITDYETGEVIRSCEEPLSEHVGRGNAKPKPAEPGLSEFSCSRR